MCLPWKEISFFLESMLHGYHVIVNTTNPKANQFCGNRHTPPSWYGRCVAITESAASDRSLASSATRMQRGQTCQLMSL
jgi:hypothetical protein